MSADNLTLDEFARVVIETARPLIEADLRERLAAAIEALPPYDGDRTWVLRLSASNLVRNRP